MQKIRGSKDFPLVPQVLNLIERKDLGESPIQSAQILDSLWLG